MKQTGFSTLTIDLQQVSDLDDPLEVIVGVTDFEGFRPVPGKAPDRAKGGRPAHDPIMMFRILIVQALNGPIR